ncbi:hypothetical protein BSLG_002664 [Batrachochytrium salamandrivorans]|nr:hypothetical protein BSLG_002664 [Batrachochytrium salamandrivorans]
MQIHADALEEIASEFLLTDEKLDDLHAEPMMLCRRGRISEPSTLTNITTIAVLKPVSSEPDAASVKLLATIQPPLARLSRQTIHFYFDNVDLDKLVKILLIPLVIHIYVEAFTVAAQHKLSRKTFHMAVNFLDGFIALHKNMPDDDFQVLGATCLFIATKLEDTFAIMCLITSLEMVRWIAEIVNVTKFVRVFRFRIVGLPTFRQLLRRLRFRNMKWDALIPLQRLIFLHAIFSLLISLATTDTRLVVFETVTGYKKYHIDPCLDFLGRHDIQPENIVGIMRDLMWDVVVSGQ